jgi:hypothetical protein
MKKKTTARIVTLKFAYLFFKKCLIVKNRILVIKLNRRRKRVNLVLKHRYLQREKQLKESAVKHKIFTMFFKNEF